MPPETVDRLVRDVAPALVVAWLREARSSPHESYVVVVPLTLVPEPVDTQPLEEAVRKLCIVEAVQVVWPQCAYDAPCLRAVMVPWAQAVVTGHA